MERIKADIIVEGATYSIDIHSPFGGGGYHIMINNFYYGSIVPSTKGWITHIHPNKVLYSDDIGAIFDILGLE